MKYFDLSEFDSPDVPGSGSKMDGAFLEKLDKAREFGGVPFHINSGLRTKEHNKKVKGKKGSSHLIGKAVDIACDDSRSRIIILKSLFHVGFHRIGIGKTFIHVDDDTSKDKNVIWLY